MFVCVWVGGTEEEIYQRNSAEEREGQRKNKKRASRRQVAGKLAALCFIISPRLDPRRRDSAASEKCVGPKLVAGFFTLRRARENDVDSTRAPEQGVAGGEGRSRRRKEERR